MSRPILRRSAEIGTNEPPRRGGLVTALGLIQIISWGSSYYLPAVLAKPIAADTGWSLPWVVGGLSIGLLAGGVVSPPVGRTIDHRGGRLVLSLSSILFGLGFCALALATSLPAYLAAWLIIGLAMGSGLYDATFATLGRIYGQTARPIITIVTLFGGLASTVCWPLTAYLNAELGWRGACLVYAGLHLAFCLPLNLCMLPRGNPAPVWKTDPTAPPPPPERAPSGGSRTVKLVLLATIFTLNSGLVAVISVHLISILQTRGMGLAAAVAVGALLGPSQVASRLTELVFGRYYHPIWTMVAGTTLIAAGLMLMLTQAQLAAAALVIYGCGVGLGAITRGTVPLRLFGPIGYATLIGRLALPTLLSQALCPSLASFLMVNGNADMTLTVVAGAALANVVLTLLLGSTARGPR
ncbi:MAG: MFS transporter [Deltaproteobacteria bacterium]|nr:MFS transporter [Deltaproteobacteria bacterium]